MPVVVLALRHETPGGDVLAGAAFAVASATDAVDGYVARARDQVTDFGKLVDPLADKLLVIGAIITLAALNRLAVWAALVIIVREVVVTVARQLAARRGQVAAALPLGKLKTLSQIVMVLVLIGAGENAPGWTEVVVGATVAVTIASSVEFAFALRRGDERRRQPA